MAPATNLGAATPVKVGIGGPQSEPAPTPAKNKEEGGKEAPSSPAKSDTLTEKQVHDAAAYIRSLAQLRGRNVEWGEKAVRELQHLLLGWELLGEARQPAFAQAAQEYVRFYLEHMQMEETQILPAAQARLSEEDWAQLNAAFAQNRDPLASGAEHDPTYDRLFTRIVMKAPAPIGVGAE